MVDLILPNIHDLVRYRFGTQSEYDQIQVKDGSTLYWITDSHRMYIGETEYTRPVVCGVDSPEGRISSAPYSLYFQETENSPVIWYNSTGDPSDWEEAFAITDFMKYAPSLSSSSEVAAIPAGQIYTLQDWAYLKTGLTDYMQFLDTSKACKLVGQDATDNQYVTALALYKWNRKVVEIPAGQSLPYSWSTVNSYDPLGVLFVKTVSQDKKEYYICSHRDQTSTQFCQPVYIELCTLEELDELRQTCMHVFEHDPSSSDEGFVNQVVYSIESNSLFKCTNVSGSSYTWEKMQTPVNVEWWDYVTTQDNHKEVPYTHEGNLGDIVVITPDRPSSSHTSTLGGEIWQCYKHSWSSLTPDPEILYYWRKIKNGVNYLFTSEIPDVETEGEQWDITYVSVNDKTQLYQLTSITQVINPDYDPDYDDPDEQYINQYNWTRLMTQDDCVDVLHIFDTDPISGQTSQTGTYGELNQLVYSTSSSKFFKCTSYNIISEYPFNVDVTWEEIDKVSKITYWNYATSTQHNFDPEGEAGNLGDMIVITKRGTTSDDVTNGGSIWICYQKVFYTDTQSTQYFWRELRDGICCEYIQGEPVSQTDGKQFDMRWLGDPQALGQHDELFRLFQNIGTYGLGINVWKEILTQNSVQQDISSAEYPNTYIPSSLAAKKYADRVSGIHDVNPNTGKITTYDGEFHDEDYGPKNQLYKIFDTSNRGAIFIAKDSYDPQGDTSIRMARYDEVESFVDYKMDRPTVSIPDIDRPIGQMYFVRYWIGTNNVHLYMRMQGDTSEDKRIAWYKDLESKADIETGQITQDTTAWYTDPNDGFEIAGEYTLIGDMCFLRAHADLVWKSDSGWNNWERVYYTLPVAATQSATAIGLCGNNAYSIATGTQQNISVLELRQLGSQYITSGGTVYFTLIYKYT